MAQASLVGSRGIHDPHAVDVVQVILHGEQRRIAGADAFMPAFGDAYSDTEIAAFAHFVVGYSGDRPADVTPHDVVALRKQQ